METLTHLALRSVLAVVLAGSLVVQVMIGPAPAGDLEGSPLRVPILVILGLGVLCIQVVTVCAWQLQTLVRRGSAISRAALRYLDAIVGAAAAACLLALAFAVTLAPGEDVAPGIVLLICGVGAIVTGFGLLVLLLRLQLGGAIARQSHGGAGQSPTGPRLTRR
ncbi:DUF2975 domain-containing protein [Nocardioides gansuensis]|uniref:DUF2975 domain-containing protein n=1 Tax=Nocardioides gansuensis TaxID=2138300 RepID=A0A2T8FFB4_9ACTN|nr:DUF2975 domain-containing protein [Nocardioides gansuensis]PVG84403.1 DUF2975 domain-containing protein [Nocardioides gansuensis]